MKSFAPFALLLTLGSLACFNGCSSDTQVQCQEGAETCNALGSGAFVCTGGAWLQKQSCDGVSESCKMVGSTASCICDEGAIKCSDDSHAIRACTSGAWVDQQVCDQGDACNYDGDQNKYVCVAADLACNVGQDRERCRVIVDPNDPNPKRSADAYVCATNGQWQIKQTCDESDVCIVRLPTQDEAIADPTLKEVAACEPIPCQEGLEYCPAGSQSGNPYVCTNGVLSVKEKCPANTACVIDPNGAATCVNVFCTPGTEWCWTDGNLYLCNDSRKSELKEACGAGKACRSLGGVSMCVETCTPDTQQCSAAGNVQVCAADKTWADSVVCTATQECVVSQGTATCRDIAP